MVNFKAKRAARKKKLIKFSLDRTLKIFKMPKQWGNLQISLRKNEAFVSARFEFFISLIFVLENGKREREKSMKSDHHASSKSFCP